nr:ROK family protein [Bifidobacterium pseudocatenulatum]
MIETAQAFGVDIGGSGIKAAPVNLEKGEFAEPRLKILTPEVSTPKAV